MTNISNQNQKITIQDFKNMIERVNKFILKNKREPQIIYTQGDDYITYKRYQDMLQRYQAFRSEKGREPNYINILPPKISSTSSTFGFYLWNQDMEELNLDKINNVTDIILSEASYTNPHLHDFIEKAATMNIRVHAWIQCLKDNDGWHQPNPQTQTRIIQKAQKAMNLGFQGVHLDYIRYPGTAYKYRDAAGQIENILRGVYGRLKTTHTNIFISAAVMPEMQTNFYYYGQDYKRMGQWLDAIIPMAYKGNYKAGRNWIQKVIEYIRNETNAQVWAGLQTYRSDSDPTPLPPNELKEDMKTAISAGAKGCILFRYGLISGDILGLGC